MKSEQLSEGCCPRSAARTRISRFRGRWRTISATAGFLVPRLAGCSVAVFGLLFAAAELARQMQQSIVFPDTGSLMEADYGAWDVPVQFSSRAGLLAEIKSGSSYGIKNPEAAFIEQGKPGGFLSGSMTANPADGSRMVMPGDAGSRGDEAAVFSLTDDPVDPTPQEEIPAQENLESAGEEALEGSALEEALETLEGLDPVNPESSLSHEEVREIVEQILEELRPEDGDLRDLDPELVDQARELQEILKQYDFGDFR